MEALASVMALIQGSADHAVGDAQILAVAHAASRANIFCGAVVAIVAGSADWFDRRGAVAEKALARLVALVNSRAGHLGGAEAWVGACTNSVGGALVVDRAVAGIIARGVELFGNGCSDRALARGPLTDSSIAARGVVADHPFAGINTLAHPIPTDIVVCVGIAILTRCAIGQHIIKALAMAAAQCGLAGCAIAAHHSNAQIHANTLAC